MQGKGALLFCGLLLVILIEASVVEGAGELGNSTALSNSSSSSSIFGDYCCKINSKGNCCTYGDCCGTTCCGKDDQCFFDKCINTGGLSRTNSIIIAVVIVLAVIFIIILLIGLCCCCCSRCGKYEGKRYSTDDSESRHSKSKGSADVELEEGRSTKATAESPAPASEPKEKTPEEIEAEQKEKECEKKFKRIIKPITEILDIYTMDKTSIDDGTEMMVLAVMRYYLEIDSEDQDGITLFTNIGSKVLDGLYAKFHKLVPEKEKNAFIGNVFGNLAEKKTEIVKACEGDFAAALAPATKAIKTAAELVRATALTQDNSILIIGAALATIIAAKKITENKTEDQNAFEEWFDSLKVYLPKDHANYLKAGSWEYAFESLE